MNQYISPELDIIKFSIYDVICASETTPPPASERDNAYVAAKDLFSAGSDSFLG